MHQSYSDIMCTRSPQFFDSLLLLPVIVCEIEKYTGFLIAGSKKFFQVNNAARVSPRTAAAS
jgi:hypothetical protein